MREERDSAAGGKLGAGTVRTNVTGNLTMRKGTGQLGSGTMRQWTEIQWDNEAGER